MLTEFSKMPTRTLSNLKNEKKNAGIKPTKIEEHISKVISCKELVDDHNSSGESNDGSNDGSDDSDDNNDSDEE
ncbi:hypothetical protein G6F37_008802 [Rhizopus arrhizus]|nr:hypothetical protein G6F38_008877 [Rhizopus arrhizus]KAG1155151.1 hypothetical protein G6F37_008802 [Rhizopus arrhizus]